MAGSRRLRMALVGGAGGFIGKVHRMAFSMDDEIELVCGAFSSSPDRSHQAGEAYRLDPARVYDSYDKMLDAEAERPQAERPDAVAIVTPNYLHADIAMKALQRGFHVICEKPMTTSREDAEALADLVDRRGLVFALMHNYSGYPMVREARARIREGSIGRVRKIVVEYPQGWLAGDFASAGVKHQSWKLDPELSGGSCCLGDIGTHAFHLAEYVSGCRTTSLCADLSVFVDYKPLEDDANLLLHFDGGARGVLYASQISINDENSLSFRIYGSQGGLEWHQEEPNTLIAKWPDRPREIVRTGSGNAYLSEEALAATRIPAGHPEGFIEAFANIYGGFVEAVRQAQAGKPVEAVGDTFPTVWDGVRGLAFIEAAWKSQQSRSWVDLQA